jgi:hypothetical protein
MPFFVFFVQITRQSKLIAEALVCAVQIAKETLSGIASSERRVRSRPDRRSQSNNDFSQVEVGSTQLQLIT